MYCLGQFKKCLMVILTLFLLPYQGLVLPTQGKYIFSSPHHASHNCWDIREHQSAMAGLRIQVLALVFACVWVTGQAVECKDVEMFESKGCREVKSGAKEALESLCAGDLGFVSACMMKDEGKVDAFGLLVHACGEVPEHKNCEG